MNTTAPSVEWLSNPVKAIDSSAMLAASQRQQQLTKPAGSLGKLEKVAIRLAGLQGQICPSADNVSIAIFAADHGIAAEGVSAFPQSVTAEMLKNFAQGGAAICVLARSINAALVIYNLGTVVSTDGLSGVINKVIVPQTANFLHQPAMSKEQLAVAMDIGKQAVCSSIKKRIAIKEKLHLFIGGEMGIANTTSATAIASALLGIAPTLLAGPGTGLDTGGVVHKAKVIEQALVTHQQQLVDPLSVLQYLGGFEIAALAGAYLTCAQQGVAALVDGFICTVAALLACRINPQVVDWMILTHTSAEPAYTLLLDGFTAAPLLNLELRLGEGSGAAIAVPLIRLACALHNDMATFTNAEVSSATHVKLSTVALCKKLVG